MKCIYSRDSSLRVCSLCCDWYWCFITFYWALDWDAGIPCWYESDRYTLNIWDVGGQRTIRSYWRNYFEQTDGLVWVVDSSDLRRLDDCKMELDNLLKEEVGGFLVLLNHSCIQIQFILCYHPLEVLVSLPAFFLRWFLFPQWFICKDTTDNNFPSIFIISKHFDPNYDLNLGYTILLRLKLGLECVHRFAIHVWWCFDCLHHFYLRGGTVTTFNFQK